MTNARLIEALSAFPPDYLIQIEGCDCIGDAEGVMDFGDGVLLIIRPEGAWHPWRTQGRRPKAKETL